jgi:hypothetical protein
MSGDVYPVGYMPVYAYGRIGRLTEARRSFEQYFSTIEDDAILPMMWVMAYLGLGDVERAYEWAARVADRDARFCGPGPNSGWPSTP